MQNKTFCLDSSQNIFEKKFLNQDANEQSASGVRKIILFKTENNIIFLTPLADYLACLMQKLT